MSQRPAGGRAIGRVCRVRARLPRQPRLDDPVRLEPQPEPLAVLGQQRVQPGEPVGDVTCEETNEWWLTADRRTLVTVYHDSDESGVIGTVICGWDLWPNKPLRWILGVPAALGIALVSLRSGWRRWREWRRRRKATAAPQATPSPA